MWTRMALAALAMVSVDAMVPAQQLPSFNGAWTVSTDAPAGMAAAPTPIMGSRFAVQVAGDRITVSRPYRDDTLAVTYPLDGSRTSYALPSRLCEGDATTIETASREGEALVLTIVGRIPAGGGATSALNIKRVFKMTDASTLRVESSIVQAGETKAVATDYKRGEALPAPKPTEILKGTPATIAQLAWLPGVWVGVNGAVTVEERWTPTASGGTIGVSRTLRGAALGNFEFLCIAEYRGTLVYEAMPDARFPPTYFTLTAITADSATFENPAHDFPKMIKYARRPDGSLETVVAGAGGQRPATVVLQRQQ